MIIENNLFKELIKRGFSVTNSNVYRTPYIEKIKTQRRENTVLLSRRL